MDRRFLGILAAIVVVFVVIFAVTQNSNNGSGGSSSSNQPTNHVEGKGTTGVKLIEYGDYECPVCGSYYPSVKQVASQYSNQIYFQFRNLPLSQIHPNAFAGARAAEAAGFQGKYWQMHDALYENQDPAGATGWVASKDPLDNYFVKFAQDIGIKDINKFKQDYSSDQANNAINADLNAFSKTGQAMATPTFFLDGKALDNAKLGVVNSQGTGLDTTKTVANFAKLIDAEIAKKQPAKQ
ncbi:MAG TPA: thioredoxin domain-containing protein [Candidatus Saccharimonadales bacterium]|nr:thioredoxin domain-containing protein [Candidatus Saccharimonadales bacterium]